MVATARGKGNLLKKQYLIAPSQAMKLADLSRRDDVSAGEIVRRAIDAYDPDANGAEEEAYALEELADMFQVTLAEMTRVRVRVDAVLAGLERDELRQQWREDVLAQLNEDPTALGHLRAALTGEGDHAESV